LPQKIPYDVLSAAGNKAVRKVGAKERRKQAAPAGTWCWTAISKSTLRRCGKWKYPKYPATSWL